MSIKKIAFLPDFSPLSQWGHNKTPFFALIDFEGRLIAQDLKAGDFSVFGGVFKGRIDLGSAAMHFKIDCAPRREPALHSQESPKRENRISPMTIQKPPEEVAVTAAIRQLQFELKEGLSYLVNFCSQTEVAIGAPPALLFDRSTSPFTIWLEDQFLSFSPESFVSVINEEIITTPMKGTGYDAAALLADSKEQAEHATIVDLLRNDLGRVARDIRIANYRYVTGIPQVDGRTLYQTSSEVRGHMAADWRSRIGDWLPQLLPAGSVTGAPKKKTVELIRAYETEARGFFTGIAAFFDGENFYSTVLIRYLDLMGEVLKFRSGAGITIYSDPAVEYQEILQKVYLPLRE